MGPTVSFPDICLTVEEKIQEKTSTRKTGFSGNRTRTRWARGNDVTPRPQRFFNNNFK